MENISNFWVNETGICCKQQVKLFLKFFWLILNEIDYFKSHFIVYPILAPSSEKTNISRLGWDPSPCSLDMLNSVQLVCALKIYTFYVFGSSFPDWTWETIQYCPKIVGLPTATKLWLPSKVKYSRFAGSAINLINYIKVTVTYCLTRYLKCEYLWLRLIFTT